MSTDIGPVRPTDGRQPDDTDLWANATPQDLLREAILHVETETARLTALEAARDRAREQRFQMQSVLSEAETNLQHIIQGEPQRRAYQFLNNDTTTADPVAVAQTNVAVAQADLTQTEDIEAALEDEIARVRFELNELRRQRDQALATFIVQTDEFLFLVAQHRDTWERLRTLKKALQIVASACKGYLPQEFANEARLVQPLEECLGYGVDPTVVRAWAVAMGELAHNSEVELPMFG